MPFNSITKLVQTSTMVVKLDDSNMKALLYALMNIVSATGIVFANKAVFQVYQFKFTTALTWIHTLFTIGGMYLFSRMGMFVRKPIKARAMAPLAAAYIGYIVLCNLNLNINTVGFYQVTKIAVAPTVLIIETFVYHKSNSTEIKLAVLLVCLGVGISTVSEVGATLMGIAVGLGSVLATALYQIWAGVQQKQFQVGSMQLLNEFSPVALFLMTVLIPIMEPLGNPWTPKTILGYHYTFNAVVAIVVSSILGIFVSLSTFLVIGATSSLTYNVVGHVKTVLILSGGCIFFGDPMSGKKLLGVSIAMCGIIWYSQLKLQQAEQQKRHLSGKI